MNRGEFESRILILVTLALLAFGLVTVYSATSAPAEVGGSNPNYYLERQGLYAILGIVLMVIAQRWDYRRLRLLAQPLVLISLALLVAVLVVGPPVNGARRWISFGPAVFQPSELAKLALASWAAGYLSRRPAPRDLRDLARPVGAMAGIYSGLLILEPDLGTAITLLVMLSAMLLIAGTPLRTLTAALMITAGLGTAAIWLEPYRRARFFAFLHPWHDVQGVGFQLVQAMIGMGSGGIFGVGLGQGVQKIFYLPEASNDMIAANIGEELGLIGIGAVIFAYAVFAYAGLRVALNCRDPFGKLLATAVTVLICGQASINLAAVMGVAPLTGIPLPFISYGGSSLVVLLASVGILLTSQLMERKQQLRCVIAAGGTAGHVLSALAVAEALVARGVLVTFAGSPERVEAQLIPEAGFELDTFRVSGFERKLSMALVRALGRAALAPHACRLILRGRQPDVVFGGGGYVAGPMVLAAATMKIPPAVSEADAHLGLANRLAAPLAKRVFLAYGVSGRTGTKYRVVGRPIPARARAIPQDASRELFGLPADGPVLLVAGALAGARALNEFAIDAFAASGPAVLHISGERDFESLRERVTRDDYRLIARTDQIGAAYSAADLVLARAGSSVWEIAAAGRPAILVPYPYATSDHQAKNAEHFVQAGGALMVREEQLTTVPDLVGELFADGARLEQMSEAMLAVARPDAADRIAEELIALAAI